VALAAAYAACQQFASSHYENFPVASRLLPAPMRPHIAAVYAFARTADDFADEDGYATADRLARLDDWQQRLRLAVSPGAAGPAANAVRSDSGAARTGGIDPALVFEALAHTIRTCRLPVALLDDLLSAFRQDVTVRRYATWSDVLDYCRRSANPVGRLVLRIAGYEDQRLDRSSDALCTALQLTNFWQDLAIDWARGRLYVPEADRAAGGALERDLDARRITPEWRAVMEELAARTRLLFVEGRVVCDGVRGRLRHELRLTSLGASRVLDRLERRGFDVFTARPALGAADVPVLAWQWLTWPRRLRPPRAAASGFARTGQRRRG
jgi:phytoene synthase